LHSDRPGLRSTPSRSLPGALARDKFRVDHQIKAARALGFGLLEKQFARGAADFLGVDRKSVV
jgi:hypothetical protein